MTDQLFQTSLYLFSALLQADAAILGFGTIFVVFKLQSIESHKDRLISTFHTKGPGHISQVNTLIITKDPNRIADILSRTADEARELYMKILCAEPRSRQIGKSIVTPLVILGSHALISAVGLFGTHLIHSDNIQILILVLAILWFAFALVSVIKLSIQILTKEDEYVLSKLLPLVDAEYNKLMDQKKTSHK